MNHLKKFKMYESPDNIKYKGDGYVKDLHYMQEDAIPFGYYKYNDKFLIGIPGSSHGDMSLKIDGDPMGRMSMNYSGRLWLSEQVMSFWDYPDPEKLKEIIINLESHLDISMAPDDFWGEWQIEIVIENGELTKNIDDDDLKKSTIIPISKYEDYYNGIKKTNIGKEIPHMMPPEKKTELLKKQGWKPKQKKWKSWQKPFENKMWYKSVPEILNYLDSLKDNTWVFIDTETTGLGGPKKQQLTQIAAVAIDPNNYLVIDEYNQKIKLTDEMKQGLDESPVPGMMSRRKVLSFNRYGDKIEGKSYIDEQEALDNFFYWIDALNNPLFVIQNAEFDMHMFGGRSGRNLSYPVLDTKMLLQLYIIPIYQKLAETDNVYKDKLDSIGTSNRDFGLTSSSMSKWAPELGIDDTGYHDALFDCKMTIEMYKNILNILETNKNLDISKYQIERIKVLRK